MYKFLCGHMFLFSNSFGIKKNFIWEKEIGVIEQTSLLLIPPSKQRKRVSEPLQLSEEHAY